MKASTIILKRNEAVFDKKIYSLYDLYKIKDNLKKNIKIIITDEELVTNEFEIKLKKFNIEKYAHKVIKDNFPQNEEILYDYEYDRKNKKLLIYYIKVSSKITELLFNCNNLKIIPFQNMLKQFCLKKKADKDFLIISEYDEKYYYIEVKNRFIRKCCIFENCKEIMQLLNNSDLKNKFIICDENSKINDLFKNNENNKKIYNTNFLKEMCNAEL